MKKVLMSLVALLMAMSVNAQKYLNESDTPFKQGKFYVNASLSSLNLDYSKASEWSFGLGAKAGYLFLDNWSVLAVFDYNNISSGEVVTTDIGAGARYHFENIGLYLGAIAKYAHSTGFNDFQPELNVGYSFFLNRHVTIEPELYYKHSFKDSDYSGFGVRLGFGYYF
jgi:outer membrane receptor for Fe3+-dicitrate